MITTWRSGASPPGHTDPHSLLCSSKSYTESRTGSGFHGLTAGPTCSAGLVTVIRQVRVASPSLTTGPRSVSGETRPTGMRLPGGCSWLCASDRDQGVCSPESLPVHCERVCVSPGHSEKSETDHFPENEQQEDPAPLHR